MQYLLLIKYDGKNYYGWSPQPNNKTVFQTIEKVVKKILNKPFKMRAAGRTDRYVHALEMPVTISSKTDIKPEDFLNQLRLFLPNDIEVLSIESVSDKFEVRYGAKRKTYMYLTNIKGEGDTDYYNNWTFPLDIEKLKKCSEYFIGNKNFQSFTAKRVYENYEREIFDIDIKLSGDILSIKITGDGFLRFMVRNIVGVMFANNRDALSFDDILNLLDYPETGKAHYKAVGAGLYLVNVEY